MFKKSFWKTLLCRGFPKRLTCSFSICCSVVHVVPIIFVLFVPFRLSSVSLMMISSSYLILCQCSSALIVECSTDGGAEFRVFGYSESHSIEFLHSREYLPALWQEGQVAYHDKVFDT